MYVRLIARYLCCFVTCASPRTETETMSWWMSGKPECLFFFLLHRGRQNDVTLYKVACRAMQVPRFVAWSFWTLGCRVGERRTGGNKYILKKQAHETQVEISAEETRATRRSLNHVNWEAWKMQRMLYASNPQTGDKKVDSGNSVWLW